MTTATPARAHQSDDRSLGLPPNWSSLDVDDDGVITDADCEAVSDEEMAAFVTWLEEALDDHPDDDVRAWRSQYMDQPDGSGPCADAIDAIPADGLRDRLGDSVKDVIRSPVDAVTGAVAKGFEAVAESFAAGAATLLRETSAAWTRVPSSSTTSTEAINLLQADLRLVTAVVATIGLIIGLCKVALKRRAEELYGSGVGLLWMLVLGSAGTAVLVQLLEAGDLFSRWLLEEAGSNGMSTGADVILTGGAITSAGLLFVLALLAIVTSIIQLALLVVRGGVIVVLAGASQLAAAASVAGGGASLMLRRTLAWLMAFVLYKPAAAICYAAAYRLMQSSEGGTGEEALAAISGLVLLVLAILALPAMIRLTVPMASMAGPSTAGVVAAGAAVATGAVLFAGGAGAGASGVIGQGGASGAGPSSGGGMGPSGASSGPGDLGVAGGAAAGSDGQTGPGGAAGAAGRGSAGPAGAAGRSGGAGAGDTGDARPSGGAESRSTAGAEDASGSTTPPVTDNSGGPRSGASLATAEGALGAVDRSAEELGDGAGDER